MKSKPTIDWLGTSEIVAGLVLKKLVDPHQVDLSSFHQPYDAIVTGLREGVAVSELGIRYAGSLSAAVRAAEGALDILTPTEWIEALGLARVRSEGAATFRKISKVLEEGGEPNYLEINAILQRIGDGSRTLKPISEYGEEPVAWFKTGWKPIDDNVGGLPDGVLTIVAGPPGTGKTSVLSKIALSYTAKKKQNKRKRVLIYSMEMTGAQLFQRMLQIGKMTKEQQQNIWVSTDVMSVDEVYAEVAKETAKGDVGFVGIDFADFMVRGSTDVASMEHIYRSCAQMAKESGVPVVLLAQLNDNYRSGPPAVNDIRWSRLAEAVARCVLLVYNPRQIFAEQGQATTQWPIAMPGTAHIIVGKSSFGTRHDGIGAIEIPWNGVNSWGDTSNWSPQPVGGVKRDRSQRGGR